MGFVVTHLRRHTEEKAFHCSYLVWSPISPHIIILDLMQTIYQDPFIKLDVLISFKCSFRYNITSAASTRSTISNTDPLIQFIQTVDRVSYNIDGLVSYENILALNKKKLIDNFIWTAILTSA